MLLSVTEDVAGTGGLKNVDAGGALFLEYDSSISRVVVHTKEKEFFTVGSLNYWLDVLNKSGYRFKRSDRNDIINLDRIVMMDQTRKIAYFEYPMQTNSKYCTFAEEKFKHTLKILGTEEVRNQIIVI